jgi:lipid A ethanolaminephosphotransferase
MGYIDDWQPASSFGDDADTDRRIGQALRQVLQSADAQFVLVVKRGNHEPHELNYPAGASRWQPDRRTGDETGQAHDVIVNTYDNAIRYNVDSFFRALLDSDGGLPRTAGIYTSDHGEELGGNGRPALVRKLVPDVVTVPLCLFGDDRPTVDAGYAASHHNIFATLLDLMNVPTSARQFTYARSLLAARASDRDPRPVLSGYMFGGSEAYEVRDFDSIRDDPAVAAAAAH